MQTLLLSVLIVIVTLTNTVFAQSGVNVETTLESLGLTEFDTSKLIVKQRFGKNVYVTNSNGRIELATERQNHFKLEFAHAGSQYIGTNNGEWGGSLKVVTKSLSEEVLSGNVVHLMAHRDQLYIFMGLDHMGMKTGSVHVIKDLNNPRSVELVATLPESPKAILSLNPEYAYPTFVIAGSNGLYSVEHFAEKPRLNILYWDAFWQFMAPTSIAQIGVNDDYLVGLPYGVALIPRLGVTTSLCGRKNPYGDFCAQARYFVVDGFSN